MKNQQTPRAKDRNVVTRMMIGEKGVLRTAAYTILMFESGGHAANVT